MTRHRAVLSGLPWRLVACQTRALPVSGSGHFLNHD